MAALFCYQILLSFKYVICHIRNNGMYTKTKTHTIRFRAINKDIFDAIKSGKKKIETRAATVRCRNIKAGEGVLLVCGKGRFSKKAAVGIEHYAK